MKVGNATVEAELAIMEGGGQALPGREKVTQLGVLALNEDVCLSMRRGHVPEIQACFEGLGKLRDFQSLH